MRGAYWGYLGLLCLFTAQATFIHKCHDCTDESCDELIPTDLTGKCQVKAHGKCFIRQDPNGLTYRGCADQGHWPDLDYSYVGCKLQRYGAWDYKKVLWCFCDFDLCNTNVTAVREFYQTTHQDMPKVYTEELDSNANNNNNPDGVIRGYQNQGSLGTLGETGLQQQQLQQTVHGIRQSEHYNSNNQRGLQNMRNFQEEHYNPQAANGNQQRQQPHSNSQRSQNNQRRQQHTGNFQEEHYNGQGDGNQQKQQHHSNSQQQSLLNNKKHRGQQPQQRTKVYHQIHGITPNQEQGNDNNNNGQKFQFPQTKGQTKTATTSKTSGNMMYNRKRYQKIPDHSTGSAQQKSLVPTKSRTKSQYYFKNPNASSKHQKSYKKPKIDSQYSQKSKTNVYQQKSMQTKQELPPIVIVPLEPPKKTYTHVIQGAHSVNTGNTQTYQQNQQHSILGGNYGGSNDNQGQQQQVNQLPSNNIPHGQQQSGSQEHQQVDFHHGQYYDLNLESGGQGQGVQTGESSQGVQDLQVVSSGANGKQFWSNVIQALLNGEGGQTHSSQGTGGGQASENNNQASCPGGQFWTDCGGCDLTCAGVQPCLAVCVPKCQCPQHSPVLHNGLCIPTTHCPTKAQQTPVNTGGGGGTFIYPSSGIQPGDFGIGITIDTDFYSNGGSGPGKESGSNVINTGGASQRQGTGNQAPINIVCTSNQVWTSCGSACLATCDNYLTLTCIRSCVAGCHCPPQLPVWHNGQCISFDTCPVGQNPTPPKGCPGNQIWTDHGQPCTPTCYNPTPPCPRRFVSRCQCPQDVPIFHNGLCMTQSQCPGQQPSGCPSNQVYMECGSACMATCESFRGLVCTLQCKAGCHCPLSAPIWHNNLCIQAAKCPKQDIKGDGQSQTEGLGIQTRQGQGLSVSFDQGQGYGQSVGVQGHGMSGQAGLQGHGISGQAGVQDSSGQGGVQGQGFSGQAGFQGQGFSGQGGVQGQGFTGQIGLQGQGISGQGVQGHGFSRQGGVQGQGLTGQSRIGIGIGVEKQGPESGSINEVDSGLSMINTGSQKYIKGGCYKRACDQICSVEKNKPLCSCRDGYILQQDARTCKDFDECSVNNGGCHQVCKNIEGSYHCSCMSGYRIHKDGQTCTDVNECQRHNGGCSESCENTEGSYKCGCRQGYSLNSDLHTCTDVDECQAGGVRCQQTCENNEGSYQCTCGQGYTLNSDGWTCDDLNECNAKSHGCEHYCMNKQGTYSCLCMAGYELAADGHTCTDLDECLLSGGGGCSHQCTNTPGSYRCTCPNNGYRLSLDGRVCADVDECQNNNGGCMHICENSQGSYSCLCQPGHTLAPDGRSCTSLNTCSDNNGGCSQLCESLPSGTRCSCRDGYKLDQDDKTCIDVDECGVKNGGCGQLCINTQGSYSCACTRGYRTDVGRKICLDIDECLNQNGGCVDGCENLLGSFRCTCPYGYTVAPDGFQCRDVNECHTQNGGCADLCINTEGSFECACRGDLFRLSPDGRSCEPLCPDSFIKSDFVNSCYRVFQDSRSVKNVSDAMETCQSLHPLAALVDIESQQERLFLSSMLANNPVMLEGWQGWWTSGVYRPELSQFQWGTGSYIDNDSHLWGFKKTPYQDTCVWILQMPVYDYTVGNFDCKTESGFICEIKVPNKSLTT